ncbi:MAG TPA: type I secretion system permease/ATPase [Pseudolabrys sp.]|nr:type I secretion system permease/ATPase [Pseudolabrys sp.]
MRPRAKAKAAAPKTNSPASDPLADALLFLAAHHGRAISREVLMAGLPVLDGRLPPPLFERAAAKAGLEGKAVRRKLAEIPALVLPAILSMRDGSTRILLAIDLDAKTATVADPSTGAPPQPHPLRELNAEYLGFAFLVRPAAFADARAVAAAGDLPRAHWFWSVARRFWSNYSHVAVAALITNLLALASPLFIMNVYDRVVPNGAMASMIALSIGMGIAVVFDFVIRMVRSRIVDMTGKKLDVIMASNIFEHVLSLKMSQRPASVGILANQIREFDSVREFFTSGTVVSITDLLFAVIFIAVLFMIGGALAFIPLFMLPVMMIVGFVLQWPLERAMRRLQAEAAARHGVLVESLTGIETVRATGAEARMQNAWERSVAATARSGEDVHHWSSLALTSASTAQQLNYLLMVIVGVFLILDGKITVGVLVACTMLSGRVLAPITGIATVITRAAQTFVTLKSINRIMQLERERPPERMYVTRRIEKGSVAFENVSFKYPGSNDAALNKVSFKVAGGERIGIIGRVGSGKTTVGRLLCGFYEPTDGKVIVDDVDARQYDPADLRTGVGFVLQDTDLFFGKIRDNIALGKPTATDEEIISAARLAGVENFIAGHPLGYDMPIAEGGRSLSGGQKQAIGLARALIRRPKVLFLDEPTAHFDVRSEADFLGRLKEIAADNMTILISTHRLSLLSFVDRILLFERGKLVADGPRDKVIAMLRGGPTTVAEPAAEAKGVKTVA